MIPITTSSRSHTAITVCVSIGELLSRSCPDVTEHLPPLYRTRGPYGAVADIFVKFPLVVRGEIGYYIKLLLTKQRIAGVAELADAYGSGPYGGNPMEVQVLSPAPLA